VAAYPALELTADSLDPILAAVDDFQPTAVEERPGAIRVFFHTAAARDAACAALGAAGHLVVPLEVDDGDWARRSQEHLGPVTVGRITVAPPWHLAPRTLPPAPRTIHLVIAPSTGFGTGHHASTRLCLHLLQRFDLNGRSVLDVGTGSGILAIAAARLGARRVVGIDIDEDALRAARENLTLNPEATGVELRAADLTDPSLEPAEVVVANLTGAALVRTASRLMSLTETGGVTIVSGFLEEEASAVRQAFGDAAAISETVEDGWMSIVFALLPCRLPLV
jgi:ribosomal protein L11 methyltransferase